MTTELTETSAKTPETDEIPEKASSQLLKGKKVFISGGSRGLGKAICQVFAREGADVAFNYNSFDEGAEETLKLIEAEGRKGLKYKVSVTDRDAIKEMAKDVHEQFGAVDILVNNAALNRGNSFATMSEASWNEVIDVNVNGLYNMTKPFFKQMMKKRSGSILNISSIAAVRAVPASVHYSTGKAAAIGFTKCLSREAAPFGITVNCIASGILDTDLGNALPDAFLDIYQSWCSKGRLGTPEEMAEFAVFLVSERNTYMTGEVIVIDGGTVI